MTSHTAPMAPATPFFLLSAYQTPTILSSKSFRLLFPGNQGHKSPPSPVGADDSAARPLVPRRPATTQCRRQNYQAINALVPQKAGTPKSPQAPRPTPSPHPSSPVPPQGDDLHPPSHSGKVSKGRAAALPLVVSRGSGGKFEIRQASLAHRPAARRRRNPRHPRPRRRSGGQSAGSDTLRRRAQARPEPPALEPRRLLAGLGGPAPGLGRRRSGDRGPHPRRGPRTERRRRPPMERGGLARNRRGGRAATGGPDPRKGPTIAMKSRGRMPTAASIPFAPPKRSGAGQPAWGAGAVPVPGAPATPGTVAGLPPEPGRQSPPSHVGGAHGGPTNRACSSRQGFQRYPSSA